MGEGLRRRSGYIYIYIYIKGRVGQSYLGSPDHDAQLQSVPQVESENIPLDELVGADVSAQIREAPTQVALSSLLLPVCQRTGSVPQRPQHVQCLADEVLSRQSPTDWLVDLLAAHV